MIDLLYALFLEPLTFDFMLRALFTLLPLSLIYGFLSCFLVLRGWALMGDALSHAVLPGIALAYIFSVPLTLGALGSALLCSLTINQVKNHTRLREDTVMAIIFSIFFGAGLVLITIIPSDLHLMHILFGNILGVLNTDLYEIYFISVLVFIALIIKHKDLMLLCFDPAYLKSCGFSERFLEILFLFALSLSIIAGLKAAGIILVIGLLIMPGAIGFLSSKNFKSMLLIALTVSLFTSYLGLILSFHTDSATAPLIITLQFIFLIFVLGAQKIIFYRSLKQDMAHT